MSNNLPSKPIVTIDAKQLAAIGASLLKETVRVLEAGGMSRNFAIACLASAANGCMKMTRMTAEQFIQGINAADGFWAEENDQVVFLPDMTGFGGQQEAVDDDVRN